MLHELRMAADRCMTATHCNTLHHIATHSNTLHHIATHCNTLQHSATYCNILHHTASHCITLQHTATHCNTLQHTDTGSTRFLYTGAASISRILKNYMSLLQNTISFIGLFCKRDPRRSVYTNLRLCTCFIRET